MVAAAGSPREWRPRVAEHTEAATAADDHDMAASADLPQAGSNPIVVVDAASKPPKQSVGAVVTSRELLIAARFPDGTSFAEGRSFLLINGQLGSRTVARGHWVRSEGSVAVFRLEAAFAPFDARKAARIPTNLLIEVRSAIGGSRQPGTMVDVSQGGMAVVVDAKPGGKSIFVVLAADGYSATLPCETVGAREQGEQTLLHLRYEELTASQTAFVRHLVNWARQALDPGLARAS